MADYDPQQLARNIENFVKGDGSSQAEPDESMEETLLLTPPDGGAEEEELPSAAAEFAGSTLPEMRRVQEVSRPVAGSRLQFFKKVILRLMAPIARRQHTYNELNTLAIESLADHVDRLSRDMSSMHKRSIRELDEFHKELSGTVEQLREDLQMRLNADNHQMRASLENLQTQLSDNIQGIWKAFEDMNARLEQARTEARDGDLGIWKGMESMRDELEDTRQMAWKVQEDLREVRARLITNSESLSKLVDHLEKLEERVAKQKTAPPLSRPSMSAADTIVEQKGLSPLVQHQLDLAYLRFQRQFRGEEEDLRRRQTKYLQLIRRHLESQDFESTPSVLDVACGDGIFLAMLVEGGFAAKGIDINPAMAKYGRDKKLPIEIGDGIAYLSEGPEDHWSAITAFQFVEHLEPPTLLLFLRAARRALAPGGILILETLNPNTLMAHKWFHLDLSHEKLVFPQMLQLLCEVVGLRHVETKEISEVPEHERLVRAGDPASQANFDRLNTLLYGPQDYFLVARKPS
ncbi:methyltransferase domain-containing protein [bacterium]|nr:methyltransferase domain-containing protein [bacterium]